MPGHSGHRQRVKTEFLARGVEGWSDHRILELLLFYAIPQGDVNELAHRLVDHFGSLAGVLDASAEELKKVPGVGDHTAVLLKLVPALGGRYQEQRGAPGQIIHSPEEAAAVLSPYFFGAANEVEVLSPVYDEAVWKPQHALHRQILPLHSQSLPIWQWLLPNASE